MNRNSFGFTGIYWRTVSFVLKRFFQLIYGPFAWSYDWIAAIVSLGNWAKWVQSVVEELDGPVVLEVGHGPGHLLVALTRDGFQAFGLDISPVMGRLASARLAQQGVQNRCITASATQLPLAEVTVQEVVATFPAEFIWEQETLEEIYRVLDSGGTLVILPVAWLTGTSVLERLAALLFRITGQSPDWVDNEIEFMIFEKLTRVGFQPEIYRKELDHSRVLIIKAVKPGEH